MARTPAKNGLASKLMATTLMMPSDKVIVDTARTRRNSKKAAQSASGTLSDAINKAEEKHLDRTAHALACKLDALDDEKLHVVYYHLMHYLVVMEVEKRATAQNEMFSAGETGAGPKPKGAKKNGNGANHDDGEDGDEDGPKHMSSTVRAVAEKAGANLKN